MTTETPDHQIIWDAACSIDSDLDHLTYIACAFEVAGNERAAKKLRDIANSIHTQVHVLEGAARRLDSGPISVFPADQYESPQEVQEED